MRLEHWLLGALTAVAVACSASSDTYESTKSKVGANDDDDDDDDESDDDDEGKAAKADAGVKRDSGSTRPTSSNDDDEAPIKKPPVKEDPDEGVCDQRSFQAKPNSPEILIVLDRSGSMIGAGAPPGTTVNRWTTSANAVKKLTSELNETVSFGLMLFPAPGAMPGLGIPGLEFIPGLGGGNACEPGKVNVPVKLSNAQAISQALDQGGPDIGSTPTTASLEAAYTALTAQTCSDCPDIPKYVLLVTDGQPTCGAAAAGAAPGAPGAVMSTPEEVAASSAALDKLREAGIKTYVVGYDMASDPASAATMETFAQHGGTEKYIPVESEADLLKELTDITAALISCEYELNEVVDKPGLVRVIIDGKELVHGDGWHLADDKRTVVLEEACAIIKDAKIHRVNIKKDCDEIFIQ